jgi:hypothetical protein
MSTLPRALYPINHVESADGSQLIVKYMSWKKFHDLVARSALYFRRIDHFIDKLEGKIPLAVWDLNVPALQAWYNRCKEEIFVCCWNMDGDETPEMWRDYAEGYGVRISSTAGALAAELSNPPVPAPAPYDAAIVAVAEKAGTVLADADPQPQDGFSLGKIKYIDWAKIEVHEVLVEEPSNTVPAFRKLDGYVKEHEFRAILRPGSVSGNDARGRGDVHVFVPVRLQNLIQEIRFAPVNDHHLERNIKKLLADNGLSIPVNPAALGITKA